MSRKILVVDDDPTIRELLKVCLEEDNYAVETAENGAEGLEKFRSFDPDLVVLDIMMPMKDGFEVLNEIREISTTPVIMVTAKVDEFDEEFDKILAFNSGVDDYIHKPFGIKGFVARIEAAMNAALYREVLVEKRSEEIAVRLLDVLDIETVAEKTGVAADRIKELKILNEST